MSGNISRDFAGSPQSIREYIAFKRGERDSYTSPHTGMTMYRDTASANGDDSRLVETNDNLEKMREKIQTNGGLNLHEFRDFMDLWRSTGRDDFFPEVVEKEKEVRLTCDLIDLPTLEAQNPSSRIVLVEFFVTSDNNYNATNHDTRGLASTLYQSFADTGTELRRMAGDSMNWFLDRLTSGNAVDLEGGAVLPI